MADEPPTEIDEPVASITPEELRQHIDSGGDVFILDVRSKRDFEAWHIDGANVEIVNHPYFQLLDGVPEDLHAKLPDDQKITVLCAKGDSSEMVAEQLSEDGYDVDHFARGMKGWARIYEYQELDVNVDATIAQYQRPSSGCLAYLIVSAGAAAVIDPLHAFTEEYRRDVRALGVELEYALDTHIHADHISGVRALAAQTDATVVLPEAAANRGVEYDHDYETVADGDTIPVGDVDIEVLSTPGHTTGMTSYKVENVLFTGDGLFIESVARPDLEDQKAARNAAQTLYDTLKERVLNLPADTTVAPAHFSNAATPDTDGTYTAELGQLKASIDVLSMNTDEFVEFTVSNVPPRPANHADIIATNLGQQSLDETTFELELGPNNCAAETLTN
ncbi:MBL fold metallo-hydrolase [Halocatena salina]|uniref:MBL fold metallo-hydrolase n=1 Tax=Halocatena salina TaxID=2934340 RepID=A0A8U0A4U0_9EURY|nr:MBL fold metallo-hydrolase [Halocatena salina]UPM44220.1 MBL fold metallo-hydrolase [Halocatena salina]